MYVNGFVQCPQRPEVSEPLEVELWTVKHFDAGAGNRIQALD